MAEETNTPDSGIDNLSQMSEFIAPAGIGANLYKSLNAPAFDINSIPLSKASVSNPTLRIKDGTSGSAPYHPKSVSSDQPKFDTVRAMVDKSYAKMNAEQDSNVYGKLYAYDNSSKGAHKARYKAYGQETYDKIGFSPEIDNETWFNENTTMYDDWKRMATQAAWPMMKLGFMSPIHSYGKLFGQADIGQDLAEAADYEEYNAIGYSTKGGIGGFAINLQNSAAYSVGILAESVVEGALIGAAVGAVAGEGVGAIPGSIIGGIGEGLSGLLKLPSALFNMSKNLGKMTMNLKKLQNISNVRTAFQGAGKAMGNFVNPFSNTAEAAMKYVFKNPDDLSNLARSARTVGAVWHDVKNINAALSEGRLEGGFTEQRVYDELYNKYYDKYGETPNDELQKSMRDQAKVAGFQNTWKNTLLVHYSNNIAFPSITKAGFMKGLPTYSKTLGKVGPFQLVYNPGKKVAEGLYSAEKISLKNAAKALTKPATYGKTALNYFKANLVEGFQETAQDVLSNATEEYYINSFKNKDRQNFDYSMATLTSAMDKQISAQGAETFASGFAMGSILSIPGGVKNFLSVGYNKYYKHRADYDTYIKERQDEVDSIIGSLNTMQQGAKNFFDPRMNNYSTQMLVGKVADDPDGVTTKEARDSSFAGFQSAIRTSLRTGTFDMFIKNFEGYKQATPEELEEAWRLEPGQGRKALADIDTAIDNAKNMAETWQYAKNKMKHVVDPNAFPPNTPEREIAEIYNQAYLTGLDNLVFMNGSFTNNASRLNSMYGKLSSLPTIQNSRFSDFATIADPARLQKEIAMLRTEVEAGKSSTIPEAKEQYEKQKNLLSKLENYQKEQNGATIDFIKRIRNTQQSIMQSEQGISANEAQKKAVDQVVAEYKEEGLDPFQTFKESFEDLLNTVAGSEENKVNLGREIDKAGGIDDLFETIMDTHLIRNENVNLNKYINLLNSPKDFYEHVQRNFEWMKKLYNNRQDYYEDVVNNSLTAIQRNTILEELAEKGVYVDLEEFANWCEDKEQLPTYFIDQVNQRIINKDSYLYDKYIEVFELATEAEVTNPIVPKSDAEQKLQRTIDNYNVQREGELETVKNIYDKSLKELLGSTQEEIEAMRNSALGDSDMTIDEATKELALAEKALKQLDSDNHLEIQAVFDMAAEKEMFTPQEYNMAKEDLFSSETAGEEVASIAQKFTEAEEDEAVEAASNVLILKPLIEKRAAVLQAFVDGSGMAGIPSYEETQPYQDYTTAVEEINTKYDDLIDTAVADFDKAAKEDVESKRPEEMKQSIQEVQELFAGKEDIVQTKRNYIVDGELHERMSNRIKAGHDTYGYTGEKDLMDLYDETIGAALKREKPKTTTTDIKADIERINKEWQETLLSITRNDIYEDERYNVKFGEKEVGYGGSKQFVIDEINAIYNEELAALEQPTTTTTDTTADIERRREKELSKLNNLKTGDFVTYLSEKANNEFKGIALDIDKAIKMFRVDDYVTVKVKYVNGNEVVLEGDINTPEGGLWNISTIEYFTNAKYDAELAALEETTGSGELDQKLINQFIEALVAADLPGVNTNKFTVDIVRDELETLISTEGTKSQKVQRYISKLQSQLSDIESKLASSKDKTRLATLQKQKVELEKAIKDEETGKYDEPFEMTSDNIKSFILNTVKENAYEESRDAGNTIDPMLKDYLDTATSVKPKWDPKKMSKEAYDALFDDETGYLTELKRRADAGEIYIFTKDLIVHANDLVDKDGKKLPSVAGEIDMIIVDRKGNKFIVDLKTGKLDKWFKYKVVGTPSYKKQLENTLQQVGYANLAQNMSGMQFEIKILPIEIGFDNKGYIVSAGKPTNPSIFVGEEVVGDEGNQAYTIGLDSKNIIQVKKEATNVYENISIEDFMQKLIPVRRQPGTRRKKIEVKKEVVIPEEERDFVDSFMNKLANAGQLKEAEKTPTTPIRKEVVTLEDAINKTVYYNGKPYIVNKEGVRYVLESKSTVIELDTTASENLSDLGIDYFEGDFYTPNYEVIINSENSVTANGTTYEIRVNEAGNVIGLSPENKPEQIITNEKLLVAVEIERNKINFINTVDELDDVDYAETIDNLKATDPVSYQKLELQEGVYNKNWNSTVESGLSKLYDKIELTDSERLAVDLWVTDAIMSMTKLYSKQSDEIYAKGLDNLEIINTLLYEGYNEQPTEVSADEPTKRKVKQTDGQKQRKPGKNVKETSIKQPVQGKVKETVSENKKVKPEDKIKRDAFEEILELYTELDKVKPTLSVESYNMLKEQLDVRASLLFDETGEIVLNIGEIYIFTEPVKAHKVTEGYRVKIDTFDPEAETVTISRIGSGRKKTFTMSIQDFNAYAMSEELINNMPKEEEPYIPSEEEVGHLTESMAVTDEQLSDFEQLAKWEDEASADTTSLDDLENDFFNNFKC